MLTFFLHAEPEALLEPAVLALVAVVLVDGAVVVSAARVGQVSTHRPLEEALAALARQHAVMFAGTSVAAYDALQSDDAFSAVLGHRLDRRRRARLEVRRACRRPDRYPACDAERWRRNGAVVVVVVVIITGSRVGDASPSRYSGTGNSRTNKAAGAAALHGRPRSARHLRRRRRSCISDTGNGHRRREPTGSGNATLTGNGIHISTPASSTSEVYAVLSSPSYAAIIRIINGTTIIEEYRSYSSVINV